MTVYLSDIEKNPINYFNALLCNDIEELETGDYATAVAACLVAVAGNPAIAGDDPIEHLAEVLDTKIDRDRLNDLVACLLLSVWKLDDGWLSEDRLLRPRVMKVLDTALKRYYSTLNITDNKQTHQKLLDLAEAVEEFDRNLESAIAQLSSIDRIHAHRNMMLRVLNTGLGEHLMNPFMPSNYFLKINEIYSHAVNYIEIRNSTDVLDVYENIIISLEILLEELHDYGTYYAQKIHVMVATLQSLIQQDFESNEVALPAELRVTRNSKKYPLSSVGQSLEVLLVIENSGTGFAYNVHFEIISDDAIKLSTLPPISRIHPQSSQNVYVSANVISPSKNASLLVNITWENYGSHETLSKEGVFDIETQRIDVDWAYLEAEDIYLLDPVDNEEELYGRESLLKKLIALTNNSRRVGSAYITGQKRVGKTSIANAISNILKENGFIVVYFEGDFINSTPEATIQYLGKKICRVVKRQDPKVADITIPTFDRDLSPARDFLDEVVEISDRRIVIILDEFDEISPKLYDSNDMADALFMALRNTSSRPNIGFILVGGEKMKLIFESQGMQLNKWKPFAVDYFDFSQDYRDIILRPVEKILEYDKKSLRLIYEMTAGNPYFTNMLCGEIFNEAISRRDLFITEAEVNRAIEITISNARANTFQHFWDDGVDKRLGHEVDKRIRRRHLLIAIRDVANTSSIASLEDILEHKLAVRYDHTLVEYELDDFVKRNILISDSPGRYRFKVQLFHKWLEEHGIQELLASFQHDDVAIKERKEQERLRVKPAEVKNLLEGWTPQLYRGQPITPNNIYVWLEQFELLSEQRAMFTMLKSLRFYSEAFVRAKLKEGHKLRVQPGLKREIKARQRKRNDIKISYLAGEAKSGTELARLYAQECELNISESVIPRNLIHKRLIKRNDINAIVFTDDFIGSGSQLSGALRSLDNEIAELVLSKEIRIVVLIVVATLQGVQNVEDTIDNIKMPVELFIGEILGPEHNCFTQKSDAFPTQKERESARLIAKKYGEILYPAKPLGFSDQGLAVVFQSNCPNNSLPILWSEGSSNKQSWYPLFKR